MAKRSFRAFAVKGGVFFALAGICWVWSAPPEHLRVAPAYVIGATNPSLRGVWAEGDPIGDTMTTFSEEIPGYDGVALQEELGRAFVSARDGWIWRVNLETEQAERFVDVPLLAAGIHEVPGDEGRIAFCAARLYGKTYPPGERSGLYELEVASKEVEPLVLRVPLPPAATPPRPGNDGTVFTATTEERIPLDAMDETNSRQLAFCNDFAVSSDGKRFYFSEPFSYEGASMGGGAVGEAITLGKNGRLWNYDAETRSVALVAQDYSFIDGVLVEDDESGRERSILVTESTKFRILRLYIAGERAGQDEVLWEALPSLPDGMERDAEGRIWIGMIKRRSGLLTWAHANPWIKPLMLRLPLELLPIPTVTAALVLSADASTALWYAEHPGTQVHDIASVSPGESGIYLANFSDETPGLHRIKNPLERDGAILRFDRGPMTPEVSTRR